MSAEPVRVPSGHVWYECPKIQGEGYTYTHDVPGSCMFCDGGLGLCTICKGFEGTLPTQCPGVAMTEDEQELVYRHYLDFKDGQWYRKEQDPWDTRLSLNIRLADTALAVIRLNTARRDQRV